MKTESNDRRRAWVEVDLSALRRNTERLASQLPPGCRLLPMVKADGYGLGVENVAHALEPLGIWGLGVATADEGEALRSAGYSGRLVVFSTLPSEDAAEILEHGLEPAITSLEALEEFGRLAARADSTLAVHIEVDTGMARLGLPADAVRSWVEELARVLGDYPLEVVSTFTHFHSADTDETATLSQWEKFESVLEALREVGIEPGLVHGANSAAALRYKGVAADMVRPGIALFGGVVPFSEAVVSVVARVLDVRDVGAGQTVSYGATYRTTAPARLATLAIGYADGLRLELSNRGSALIRGRKAPIRGAVCMDVTVVDVTEIPDVRPGDTATLLGRDGAEEITLQEWAAQCGTIEYEILTGLSSRLPRLAVEND